MEVAFISDVHGNWDEYQKICAKYPNTIQVGDFGIGFEHALKQDAPRLSLNHRFIRGNHDNPQKCRVHPNNIPDGHTEVMGGAKVMFIGGAWSSDQHRRTEGVNWWRDEENSYADFQRFIDTYEQFKPDLMVTHDCPTDFAEQFMLNAHKSPYPSITGKSLQIMHEIHQPSLWVMGHWHKHIVQMYKGTQFHCDVDTRYAHHGVTVFDL